MFQIKEEPAKADPSNPNTNLSNTQLEESLKAIRQPGFRLCVTKGAQMGHLTAIIFSLSNRARTWHSTILTFLL
jgi:hypothetical protein